MPRLLRDIAYVRSGDKGDTVTIGVVAKAPEYYPDIVRTITPNAIRDLFRDWVRGPVNIFEMRNIEAIVIYMQGALGGGATRTLRLDQTAKALGNAVLRLPVEPSL